MNDLSIILILTGAIFILTGTAFKVFPHKNIGYYGYKTISSMRNIETWRAANKYASGIMIFLGVVLVIIAAVVNYYFPVMGVTSSLIGLGIIVLTSIIFVAFTENYLGKTFDKEGKRRLKD